MKNLLALKYLSIILILFISGCVTSQQLSQQLNHISIGISKSEVIRIMGMPTTVSAKNNIEYLQYRLCYSKGGFWQDYRCLRWEPYFVKLKNGAVISYGRRGDFNSTKIPETKTTIDINIKQKRVK